MERYKLTLSYDGTSYGGWQIQPNTVTIQQVLEETLSQLLNQQTHVRGSGRTDAGVHAVAQTAHFTTDRPPPSVHSLNALLPPDIRILDLQPVDPSFHACYSATGKIYHYNLDLSSVHDPFTRPYALHIRRSLDLDRLQEAIPLLIGTHDFASFANTGSSVKTTTRTLYTITLSRHAHLFRLTFHGNGFLYKMVRNLTQTLLHVASHKLKPHDIPPLLAACDRRLAPPPAPPTPFSFKKSSIERLALLHKARFLL